jgi:hypothetical protein
LNLGSGIIPYAQARMVNRLLKVDQQEDSAGGGKRGAHVTSFGKKSRAGKSAGCPLGSELRGAMMQNPRFSAHDRNGYFADIERFWDDD